MRISNALKFVLVLFVGLGVWKSALADDTIRIAAVGDIMLGTHYPSKEFLPLNGDCSHGLKHVQHYFKQADIAFANLEGVLTDGHANAKRCNNPSVCYTFGMPTSFGKCIKDAGINLLSIANNHVGDFGDRGRTSTAKTLDEQNIHYAGLLSCPSKIFVENGVKYGFCAFAPNTGTVDLKNIAAAETLVRKLANECDVLIVSFHGGAEGKSHQHVTRKTENFIGENRGNVYEFAHRMIDAGADVLLGHGPHVTRAIEVYKGRFITYSMGNFYTYSRISISGVSGLAPLFNISINKKGEFLKAQVVSTHQEKSQPVKIDAQNRVLKLIQSLTKADFPEMNSVLTIDDQGIILPIRK